MKSLSVLLLSAALIGTSSWSGGQPLPRPSPRLDPNIRNIQKITIKWKRTANIPQAQPPTAEELQHLTQAAGVGLTTFKDHRWGVVFQLPRLMSWIEAEEIAARIRALPEIEYANPDDWAKEDAVPNDPLFQSRQWNLQPGSGGSNVQGAWDLLGAGDAATVVAVLDGGLLFGHEDLLGRVVTGNPAGYDFVSDATVANDGDGRDSNPADPGNWVSSTESGVGVFAN